CGRVHGHAAHVVGTVDPDKGYKDGETGQTERGPSGDRSSDPVAHSLGCARESERHRNDERAEIPDVLEEKDGAEELPKAEHGVDQSAPACGGEHELAGRRAGGAAGGERHEGDDHENEEWCEEVRLLRYPDVRVLLVGLAALRECDADLRHEEEETTAVRLREGSAGDGQQRCATGERPQVSRK